MVDQWVKQKQKDFYYKSAQEEGYRARSAFKLLEIQKKYKIIKRKDKVVDLGSSPGSWSQIASKLIGPIGKLVSVDLIPMAPLGKKNAKFILSDITRKNLPEKIEKLLKGKADVIISDISPEFSGVKSRDLGISSDLNNKVLEVAKTLLKKEGNLIVKVFLSQETEEFISEIKKLFAQVRVVKPKSSVKKSSEMYVIAISFGKK